MKKTIISTILLSNFILINSQSVNDLTKQFENNIKSPQAADFIRYGNIPIKKNVGELDLNIPLMSIPTQENINIDVSLAYNASGFIPSKKSGSTGFNWSLITGGAVTREVIGESDDQLGSPEALGGTNGRNEHGYLVGIRQFGSNTNLLPTDNDLINWNVPKLVAAVDHPNDKFYEIRFKGYPDNGTTRYETTPDMFSFNFNGISGKFFIAPNGSVEVITNEPHKLRVDLSGMATQTLIDNCAPRYNSEIKITDEMGNKYYFGGASRNLEYSVFLGSDPAGDSFNGVNGGIHKPIINSWQLTKVETATGGVIKYNYLDDKLTLGTGVSLTYCHQSQNPLWHNTTNNIEIRKFIEFSMTPSYSGSGGNIYSLIKKTYLSNIEYKDYKISMTYSDQDNLYKNMNLPSSYSVLAQKKIDKIELFNKNNLIKNIDLKYEIYNTQYPRIFLKSVQESGKPPYTLSYNTVNAGNTPVPNTYGIDYWGFYNGKLSNDPYFSAGTLTPGVFYESNGDFQYTTDTREPNFEFAKMYALQSIQYPTKGSSIFEYEPHQYSLRLERRSDNNFLPKIYSINGISGGTRIKKIYDFDLLNNQNVRSFIYEKENLLSSGILSDWPRYNFKLRIQTSGNFCSSDGIIKLCIPWSEDTNSYINTSSGYSKNLFENAVINYNQVSENLTNRGSVIDYYTSYVDKPDIYYDNVSQLTTGTYAPETAAKYLFVMPNDRSLERGKLYKKLIRDESNNLLEETNILYNIDPARFDKFHASMNISNAWMHPLKTYYYNDFISSSITKKYFNNSILQTETKYFYENPSHNMLTKIITTYPDNTEIKKQYQYAHEKGNQLMIDKNMVAIPLETSTTQILGSTTKTLSKTETIYPKTTVEITNNSSSLVLPLSVLSYDLQTNVPSTEATYDKYDFSGNIQQYTTRSGISTTVIWGYNKTQPVAKIEGAKLSDIAQSLIDNIVTASDNDALLGTETSEQSLVDALDLFRNNSALSNYQISTYTYNPLIGVTSITPPSGIREIYIYDTANRLKEVKQLDKDASGNPVYKILKEFKYNYKQ